MLSTPMNEEDPLKMDPSAVALTLVESVFDREEFAP